MKDGDVFFDVGANLGQYGLRIGNMNGGKIRVYLFEPYKENFLILCKHFASKKNIIVENKAVSDYNGIADLYIPVIDNINIDTQASINLNDRTINFKNYEKQKADTVRIDDYVEQQGINKADYIKIDTEGHDDRVILGAGNTIKRFLPVIMTEDIPSGDAAKLLREYMYTEYYMTKKGNIISVDIVSDYSRVSTDLVLSIPEIKKEQFINYINLV
ncbi:MAG: FkbM family methyltransferase [Ignavibacteria bacterium]|nr:FkbM family methyltransferase [Ignavibacteria bacterium]